MQNMTKYSAIHILQVSKTNLIASMTIQSAINMIKPSGTKLIARYDQIVCNIYARPVIVPLGVGRPKAGRDLSLRFQVERIYCRQFGHILQSILCLMLLSYLLLTVWSYLQLHLSLIPVEYELLTVW